MKKAIVFISCLVACCALSPMIVFGQSMSEPGLPERVERLEKQMEAKQGFEKPGWLDRFEFSALIEVEAGWTERETADGESEDESDITVSTVELGVEAKIVDHVSGKILFLYEEDSDDDHVVIDEAVITVSGEDIVPAYLAAGKMYVPFGNFETHMISDPMTLEIAEIQETAVQAGFEAAGFFGSVFVFNGDVEEADDDDNHIDNFGANIGYGMENDDFGLEVGLSYVNDLIDADSWEDVIDEEGLELDEYVGGMGAYAIVKFGPATLIGEYVTALDDIEWIDADGNSVDEDKISAWNIEAAYSFEVAGKGIDLALAYQGTDEAWNRLPEDRYVGSVGVGIFEYTTLALEYRHDDYENDDEEDAVTAQLAFEF